MSSHFQPLSGMSSPSRSESSRPSSSSVSSEPYAHSLEAGTVSAVNWDALLEIACKCTHVQRAHWGTQETGAYNLVRFLHLNDKGNIIIVIKVPLLPAEGVTHDQAQSWRNVIASQVATMPYVAAHSSIPVPHIIYYNPDFQKNAVHYPYTIMSKMDGIPLSAVWRNMADEQRDILLSQTVDVLLEMASLRFDKLWSLFKSEGEGGAWDVMPEFLLYCPPNSLVGYYTSGPDAWIAMANRHLRFFPRTDLET